MKVSSTKTPPCSRLEIFFGTDEDHDFGESSHIAYCTGYHLVATCYKANQPDGRIRIQYFDRWAVQRRFIDLIVRKKGQGQAVTRTFWLPWK